MPSTSINNNTTIVFRVPSTTNNSLSGISCKEYRIPASRLSPTFREQYRSPGVSGPSITITLDENTTEHYDIYDFYLNKDTVRSTSEIETYRKKSIAHTLGESIPYFKKSTEMTITPEEARIDYHNLLACYTLGATLHDHRFQDAVASKLVTTLRARGTHQTQLIRLLDANTIKAIIEQYGTQSPLFLLLVAAYARFASVNDIGTLAFSSVSGSFKSHVLKEMAGLRAKQHIDGVGAPDFVVSECRFHGHDFYAPCSLRRR
ncbi:hypothetical protein FB567DRAFT_614246 [Paraphoma chrysanthemicola]|uniref:Uncharacterized protein n=1 Tax=Paraphoma chrysanthemicola TaxID=798071 RepID=A0A8K0W2N0_9PLEO|nr:hypothetical protein FB567DRAFT_614246 [Paraphoma chrysanthemicola]